MKISKIFFAITFSLLISSFAFANPNTSLEPTESTKTVTTKIMSIIQNLDINFNKLESKTVKVKFIINESDELIVLSTTNSDLDRTLKNALNYTEVSSSDIKYNKVYILPVTFQ
jgi:uncharacterized membrane-anchored protein YitT (DUF2179 family)